MATKRYLVGGPSNSGKSTYVLSLAKRLQSGHGLRSRAIELDVWSGSYPAFRGEVTFKDRPKKTGLDWDWKTPLDARLKEFNEASEDVVLGDLPGAKIDAATDYMCANAKADGAIVVSRTLDGLKLWREAFIARGVRVVHECLSVQGQAPLVLRDMDRKVDAEHPDVALFAGLMAGDDHHAARMTRAMDQRFLTVFKSNYTRRSRTAHGRDDNLDAPFKKQLMIDGDELKLAAMRNCMLLAKDVLETPRPPIWDGAVVRRHCERWFDLANDGIYGPDWYEEEFEALKADATLIERARGAPVRVNPRYRLWTPEHTLMKVPPLLLEEQMDVFYARVADLASNAEKNYPSWNDTVEAMAYADLMTDGELRPWLDGCGRVAVALVMWLARSLGAPLPLFAASKQVHKMTFRDLDKHRLYFLESIRRAEQECP
ncbi:MAG TPA: hypothetical protein VL426_07490 [Candidatus Binatia bacterium]|jgi:hypothetical protein|nr:hypothetical protein [Candidatus Binatia bacterium]